jgi:hypothetical protein
VQLPEAQSQSVSQASPLWPLPSPSQQTPWEAQMDDAQVQSVVHAAPASAVPWLAQQTACEAQ